MNQRLGEAAGRITRALGVVVMVGLVSCAGTTPPRRASDSVVPKSGDSRGTEAPPHGEKPHAPSWIGVSVKEQPGQPGLLVLDVVAGGPAGRAGIVKGDVISGCEREPTRDAEEFVRRIQSAPVGYALTLSIARPHGERDVRLVLEALPSDEQLLASRFIGQPAPSLDGTIVLGAEHPRELLARHTHFVLLEFWAPFCAVCRVLHQRLGEWQSQWSSYPVALYGIAKAEPEETAALAQSLGMKYPQVADPDETCFRRYGVFALPSLFLIDERGNVLDVMVGYRSEGLARIEQRLVAELARKSR